MIDSLMKYFGGKLIGSGLMVIAGLLKEEDINDWDIMLIDIVYENAKKFLEDNGYVEGKYSIYSREQLYYIKENKFIGNGIFTKKGEKNIHIIKFEKSPDVYTPEKIIAEKYKRGTEKDIIQLKKIMENLILKNGWGQIEQLKHTTI